MSTDCLNYIFFQARGLVISYLIRYAFGSSLIEGKTTISSEQKVSSFKKISAYFVLVILILATVPSWSDDLSKCAKFYKSSLATVLSGFVKSVDEQVKANDGVFASFTLKALNDAVLAHGENTSVNLARIPYLLRNQLGVFEFKMEYLMNSNPEVGEFVFKNLSQFSPAEKEILFHGVFFIEHDLVFGLSVVTTTQLDFRHAAESIHQMWKIQNKIK